MPPAPPPNGEFSDSDQLWLDRLSGKPGDYPDTLAVREADAMRMALEQEEERLVREAQTQAESENTEHAWQRLQFAIRREGLLQPRRRPRWTWPALGGVAAAVLLGAAMLPLLTSQDRSIYPEPPVLRGGLPVRQVAVPQPRAAAEQFAQTLQAAGLKPALYQQAEDYVVDVVLRPGQAPSAAPAFQRLGLEPSPDLNRIVFSER
jgi:hypothetical protein